MRVQKFTKRYETRDFFSTKYARKSGTYHTRHDKTLAWRGIRKEIGNVAYITFRVGFVNTNALSQHSMKVQRCTGPSVVSGQWSVVDLSTFPLFDLGSWTFWLRGSNEGRLNPRSILSARQRNHWLIRQQTGGHTNSGIEPCSNSRNAIYLNLHPRLWRHGWSRIRWCWCASRPSELVRLRKSLWRRNFHELRVHPWIWESFG